MNMKPGEYAALKELRKDRDVIIKKTDKGGGICVIDKKEYEDKVLKMLEEKETYEELNYDPTYKIVDKIINEIVYMRNSLVIPEKVAEFMLPSTEARTPLFYGLPKVHKLDVPLRPIESGCEGPTDNISEYVVKYLRPMAKSLPSYYKDSTELLKILCSTQLPEEEYILITAEVVSLYTNIPHNDGIEAIRNFISNKWNAIKHPDNLPPLIPTDHFCRLLKLILENMAFMFGPRTFYQKFGTSMGTRMAPPYANIFMGELDQKIVEKYKNNIVLYKRFIDDVLIIFRGTSNELEEAKIFMNKLHRNITFTFTTSS
ncbi:uncharacterized protein LOC136089818 [Hydra vulgaris]|uniref:Uncharacterized protein LOC136089818 n=1 Tax=Hydra vulgaris TaxID=6087 RepID=A0ABM4DC54_HYDVU